MRSSALISGATARRILIVQSISPSPCVPFGCLPRVRWAAATTAACTCTPPTWRDRRSRPELRAAISSAQPSPPRAASIGDAEGVWDSAGALIKFAVPLIALVLCEPLLVWTTTLFIGHFSTISQLAALGPANIVISTIQYVFISIQIGAMGMLGELLRNGEDAAAQALFSSALGLSLFCGALAGLALTFFPEQLVAATGLQDPEVVSSAASYLRLRAAGQLALLISMVCQAAFLAQQDPSAPSLAGLLAAVLAVAGHVLLVGMAGWGLSGAAVATTAGNLAGIAFLLTALHDRGKLRPAFRVPSLRDIRSLSAVMAPLAVTYVSKNLCYMVVQTTATTVLDVTRLAAHQALYSAWGFCSFWVGPVERALLALLPVVNGRQRKLAMQAGLLLGLAVGAVGGGGICFVALFQPQLLSHDPRLWPLLGLVAPQAFLSLVCTGIDVCGCAINIAAGDANYVAQSFVLTFALVSAFMTACRLLGWGFSGVWNGIMVFFLVRALQSCVRAVGSHVMGQEVPNPEEQRLLDLGEGLVDGSEMARAEAQQALKLGVERVGFGPALEDSDAEPDRPQREEADPSILYPTIS